MKMNKKIDPISLEITWNSLKSVADECFITLMRSAFSTNIKERHDHSTAITNSKGKLRGNSRGKYSRFLRNPRKNPIIGRN